MAPIPLERFEEVHSTPAGNWIHPALSRASLRLEPGADWEAPEAVPGEPPREHREYPDFAGIGPAAEDSAALELAPRLRRREPI